MADRRPLDPDSNRSDLITMCIAMIEREGFVLDRFECSHYFDAEKKDYNVPDTQAHCFDILAHKDGQRFAFRVDNAKSVEAEPTHLLWKTAIMLTKAHGVRFFVMVPYGLGGSTWNVIRSIGLSESDLSVGEIFHDSEGTPSQPGAQGG